MRPAYLRVLSLAVMITIALLQDSGRAMAEVPVGPANYVACPGTTGVAARYTGPKAPYRCHSAVKAPNGVVVILRQGVSDGSGANGFGFLHALRDHNVSDHAVERVVSSAFPLTAPRGRVRFIAYFRAHNDQIMTVWVEVDLKPSKDAPDNEPFGVVTAYCKLPASANPESRCPDWVNESL